VKITVVAGFLLPVPPARGGAMEKTWHRLALLFAAAGHEVTVVSRRWPGWPDHEIVDGVRHLRVRGADHTSHLALNLLLDFIWGLRVTRVLPAADVVITNTVALPVWLRRIKPAAGRVVAVMARMPKGQTRLYGGVDLLLSLSAAVSARIVAENPGLAGRIVPFPLPIDCQLQAGPSRRIATLTIGYIGRINPEKGIALLLAAAVRLAARSDLPPWRLVLQGPLDIPAGGGGAAWFSALRHRHAAALGDRLVLLPPEYDSALLAQCYAGIDVFCYPSLAEHGETFGVAVAEAMAAQCAPVVSGLACFRELVADGETGLVFDHSGPAPEIALEHTLARLLSDSVLRAAIADRARSHVRRFDYPVAAANLLARLEPG